MNFFSWIPGYTDGIYNEGKEPMLLLFVAYLITFICTRLYTRLARVRRYRRLRMDELQPPLQRRPKAFPSRSPACPPKCCMPVRRPALSAAYCR